MYFVLRSAPLSPPTPLLLSPLRCPTSQLSLSFSLRCRRVAVVLLFFKLTAQLEFFSTMWVALSLSSRRSSAPHRVVEWEWGRESERQGREYIFLPVFDKMPYGSGSGSRYATVGGAAAAAEAATAPKKTVLINAIKCNLVHCTRISAIYRTLLRMLCRLFVLLWKNESVTLSLPQQCALESCMNLSKRANELMLKWVQFVMCNLNECVQLV